MKEIKTESVRVDKKIVDRVRSHVARTRQTIGGFISVEVEKILDKIEGKKKSI